MLFHCCPELKVLSLVLSKNVEIECDPSDTLRTSAKKLKFLKLNWSGSEKVVEEICKVAVGLEELHLLKLPSLLSSSLPELKVLALKEMPSEDLNGKWLVQFPNLMSFIWQGSGTREKLNIFNGSKITELHFSLNYVHPFVPVSNLTSLKLSGNLSNENDEQDESWTVSKCVEFLQQQCSTLKRLHLDCGFETREKILKFIAEKCRHLELLNISLCTVEQWKLFCQLRKSSGNVENKLRILTNAKINWDLLLDSNVVTFGGIEPWVHCDRYQKYVQY